MRIRRRDSNPRPLRPERNALPTALRLDLAFFVSGQTCGQTTYFGIFSLSCTDEIVRFFKAFSDLQNRQVKVGWFAPECNALLAATGILLKLIAGRGNMHSFWCKRI